MAPDEVFEDCHDSDGEDVFEDCPLPASCYVTAPVRCQPPVAGAGDGTETGRAAHSCAEIGRSGVRPSGGGEGHGTTSGKDRLRAMQTSAPAADTAEALETSAPAAVETLETSSPAADTAETLETSAPAAEILKTSALSGAVALETSVPASADTVETLETSPAEKLETSAPAPVKTLETGAPAAARRLPEMVCTDGLPSDVSAPHTAARLDCSPQQEFSLHSAAGASLRLNDDGAMAGDGSSDGSTAASASVEHLARRRTVEADCPDRVISPQLSADDQCARKSDVSNILGAVETGGAARSADSGGTSDSGSSENSLQSGASSQYPPSPSPSVDNSSAGSSDSTGLKPGPIVRDSSVTQPAADAGRAVAVAEQVRSARQPSSSSEDSVVEALVSRGAGCAAAAVAETPSSDDEAAARLTRGGWHLLEQPPPPAEARLSWEGAASDLSQTLTEAEAAGEQPALPPHDGAGGEEGAAAAGDEPELVVDPDAVDEELLRRMDDEQTEPEREARRLRAAQLKDDGNRLFAAQQFDVAREQYTAALRLCPLAAAEQRAVLFSNRAACRARAADETGAVADCSCALQLQPTYVKPLQRRAQLYQRQQQLDEALADWRRLLELEPAHAEARRAVARLPAEIDERNEQLKTEMLSKLKDLGNMILRPFNLSTDNFQLEQNAEGGYSVKFQQQPPPS